VGLGTIARKAGKPAGLPRLHLGTCEGGKMAQHNNDSGKGKKVTWTFKEKPGVTLSKRLREISPRDFSSPLLYARAKHGVLLNRNPWMTKNTIPEPLWEQAESEHIQEQIEQGNENLVFDFVRYPNDPQNLAHPVVLDAIRKWQDMADSTDDFGQRYKFQENLRRIGECLVPDKRGKKQNNIEWPPDVFSFLWMREWLWFRILGQIDRKAALDVILSSIDFSDLPDAMKLYEADDLVFAFGMTKKQVNERLENAQSPHNVGAKKVNKYRGVAREETAEKFKITSERVMKLLSEYDKL
jgi:hypothetical protein